MTQIFFFSACYCNTMVSIAGTSYAQKLVYTFLLFYGFVNCLKVLKNNNRGEGGIGI